MNARLAGQPVHPQNNALQYANLHVVKRSGQAVPYDDNKITVAMTKAFLAVEGQSASGSARVRGAVEAIARDITQRIQRRLPDGGSIHIEDIQDQVELGLMRNGFQKVARAYVLYRDAQNQKRLAEQPAEPGDILDVIDAQGNSQPLNLTDVAAVVHWACAAIPDVDVDLLLQNTRKTLFNGMKADDVPTAMIMAARPLIETDPGYSNVCAQLLLQKLWSEVVRGLQLEHLVPVRYEAQRYGDVFQQGLHTGIEHELLSPELIEFDLERLSEALRPERDRQFTYLGLQTLYDRYFLHTDKVRIELPQTFFMRVAMGLALNEDDRKASCRS